MDYSQTLEWLFAQLPMYQRVGGANYKIDLQKTKQLMEILDHPEKKFKSIHVAGTNGKGSTSHMLASILQEKGLKVGLYTSPHLLDFRERVKINGHLIAEAEVIDFVAQYQETFIALELSFFEMTVGLAFHHFAKSEVDIAIIEVGMGGRLDSTNVIIPLVSVITNISLDHKQFLGDTLPKIAAEKAGIIKPNVPVVIGRKQQETTSVFEAIAKQNNASLFFAEAVVDASFESDLVGNYQQENKRTVLAALQQLPQNIQPSAGNIKSGFKNVMANTGLQGRWQTVATTPLTICDTGHNQDGIAQVLAQIAKTPHQKLHIVWGMVNDKEIADILAMLPKEAHYYFAKPNLPRGLDAHVLQATSVMYGLKSEVFNNVASAYKVAAAAALPDDLIFVGGSTFVVADFLAYLKSIS